MNVSTPVTSLLAHWGPPLPCSTHCSLLRPGAHGMNRPAASTEAFPAAWLGAAVGLLVGRLAERAISVGLIASFSVWVVIAGVLGR